VFHEVPARVCPNCGEEYIEDEVAGKLLKDAESAIQTGIRVEIREYLAA
jgi:hypothetical protein